MVALQVELVREKALEILSVQPLVPLSPAARMPDGSVALCLGGLIAVSATHCVDGEQAANDLAERLVQTGSRDLIVNRLAHFGWSREFAWQRLGENDASPADDRRQLCRASIASLASPRG
jgi:hypothetical protein